MTTSPSPLPPFLFQGLTAAIFKIAMNDDSVSMDSLRGKYGPSCGLDDSAFAKLVDKYAMLLLRGARENWTSEKLRMMCGKEILIDASHVDILLQCWASDYKKLRRSIANESIFNNRLGKFSWRIDLLDNAGQSDVGEEARALVEMAVAQHSSSSPESVVFEMTADDVAELEMQVQNMQKVISEAM